MAIIRFAVLQGLCCLTLASDHDGVSEASISMHHGMGPPQLPPNVHSQPARSPHLSVDSHKVHSQPARSPHLPVDSHKESLVRQASRKASGKFPAVALQQHKANIHPVMPELPPLPHRGPEPPHSPLLRRGLHHHATKERVDSKKWNLLSEGTPRVVGQGLSLAKEVASVVESSGGIAATDAANGPKRARPHKKVPPQKRKGGKIITRALPKTQFDYKLRRRYDGTAQDYGEYHQKPSTCYPNQMMVGPSYARFINDSAISSLSDIPDTCQNNCNASNSRIDYALKSSYCGEIAWKNFTNQAEGFEDPTDTCYVIYNFTQPVLITGIATAGRSESSFDVEGSWVTSFDLYYGEYNRSNGTYIWTVQTGLPGNTDPSTIVHQSLVNPVLATYIMLVGTFTNGTANYAAVNGTGRCCFRADFVGCPLVPTTTTRTTTTTTTGTTHTITYAKAAPIPTTTTTAQAVVGLAVPVPVVHTTTIESNASNDSNVSNVSNKSAAPDLRARFFFVEVLLLIYSLWLFN